MRFLESRAPRLTLGEPLKRCSGLADQLPRSVVHAWTQSSWALARGRRVVVGAVGLWGAPVPDRCPSRLRHRRAQMRSDRATASRRTRTPVGWSRLAEPDRAPATFASADIMWSIHMSMQFGCAAFLAIIQVSDQPVEPSSGCTPAIGRRRRLEQVGPEAATSCRRRRRRRHTTRSGRCRSPQYSGALAFCASSSAIAAANCSSLS